MTEECWLYGRPHEKIGVRVNYGMPEWPSFSVMRFYWIAL